MHSNLKIIYLLNIKNKHQGFTLIELMIVLIMVGILAAIAMPNFLGQIGKAREAEAKSNLGIIARAQQAYHYEHQEFYSGADLSLFGDATVGNRHYDFTGDASADEDRALHTAYANDPLGSKARDFAAGVYFIAPDYSQVICIADALDNDGASSSVTAQADGSCSGGTSIK